MAESPVEAVEDQPAEPEVQEVQEAPAEKSADQEATEQSLTEAIEGLTVGEVRVIERHYGKSLDSGQLSGTDLTVAVIWSLERRRALTENRPRPDWRDFDSWTMKQVNGYFAPEPVEVDDDAPETPAGKGGGPDA